MLKKFIIMVGLVWLMLAWAGSFPVQAEDRRLLRSRVLVRELMSELKTELKAALRTGGLVNAIKVCREVAPRLAVRKSELVGGRVGRTSLRCRNQANRPDAWEAAGLQHFEERRRAGETLAGMELWEVVDKDGRKVFRYLRAIPTGSLCLKCHGSKINSKLLSALRKHYPEDQATGFGLGELRGAFTVSLPE